MGLFKRSINSDEYEKLAKRITDVEAGLDRLVAKFMSLRGLIHRKKLDQGLEETDNGEDLKGGYP
ncbi:unnamed protein product [marine sediment metagenome]|uniref:Uncharacterized protein n=1 Tax=marine sediment metagenome TaxID=412755 RepID=X1LM86_9ZZZZ